MIFQAKLLPVIYVCVSLVCQDILSDVMIDLHNGSRTVVGRDRGHPKLVEYRLRLVKDVQDDRHVVHRVAHEALVQERILPDDEGLGDHGAVDAVVDADGVARIQLTAELLQALHMIWSEDQSYMTRPLLIIIFDLTTNLNGSE